MNANNAESEEEVQTIDQITEDDMQGEAHEYHNQGNNETLTIYPELGETEYGIARQEYDGMPAVGVVIKEIVDIELVYYSDEDNETVEDLTGKEIRWNKEMMWDTVGYVDRLTAAHTEYSAGTIEARDYSFTGEIRLVYGNEVRLQ